MEKESTYSITVHWKGQESIWMLLLFTEIYRPGPGGSF